MLRMLKQNISSQNKQRIFKDIFTVTNDVDADTCKRTSNLQFFYFFFKFQIYSTAVKHEI